VRVLFVNGRRAFADVWVGLEEFISRTDIEAFAKNHHWHAQIEGRTVIFRSAEINSRIA
jgi:hypothetical protein